MSVPTRTDVPPEIEYPDTDGEPIAENTRQFRWIMTVQGGIDALFRGRPDVFVAGDLLWYPVEGNNTLRLAPDTMVVFGRPKGDRGSYMQWREEGIPPQVVFEILSPGNRAGELARKFKFYERFGVQEYYIYDPDEITLEGWGRVDGAFRPIEPMDGWTSPLLGIRFDLSGEELRILGPDGRPFATYLELADESDQARLRADQERHEKEQAQQRADQERHEKEQAQQRADQERHEKEQAQQRAFQERQEKEQAQQRAFQERQEKEQAQQRAFQERQEKEQAQQRALQERQEKEQAQQRALQEHQEKEQAQQRAERLAAQLRGLGIEPGN